MILFEKLLANIAKKPKFVHFDDPEVERVFLANFDKDRDGKIGIEEAKQITSIGTLFVDNAKVKSLNALAYTGITSFSNSQIMGMEALEEITFPNSIKSISWYTFGGYSVNFKPPIKKVIILENKMPNIPEGFDKTVKEYVDYPEGVKLFGFDVPSLNANCTVIRAKTPPVSNTGKNGKGKLYVPDESVQSYRESKYFSKVADRIFPLSELNK